MQSRVLAVLASFALAASVKVGEDAARAWLHEHPAPQGDELSELKSANPEAYAIVKALLTKRSLGLLDPKHPTASFAPKANQAEAVPQGPEVFQAFASPGEKNTHLDYPDAPVAPAHHDWLNWHPKESAADDDAMVSNVLGAVAELKAGQAGKSLRGSSDGASSEPSLEWGSANVNLDLKSAPRPVAQTTPAAAEQENSDLKVPTSSENSYLKSAGFSVSTAAPKADKPLLKQGDDKDYLSSFSWDDDAKPAKATPVVPKATEAQPAQKKNNALLSWLGGSSDSGAVHKAAAPTTAAPMEMNPYLSALQ